METLFSMAVAEAYVAKHNAMTFDFVITRSFMGPEHTMDQARSILTRLEIATECLDDHKRHQSAARLKIECHLEQQVLRDSIVYWESGSVREL